MFLWTILRVNYCQDEGKEYLKLIRYIVYVLFALKGEYTSGTKLFLSHFQGSLFLSFWIMSL